MHLIDADQGSSRQDCAGGKGAVPGHGSLIVARTEAAVQAGDQPAGHTAPPPEEAVRYAFQHARPVNFD